MPAHALAFRSAFLGDPALFAAVIAARRPAAFAAGVLALILSLHIFHMSSKARERNLDIEIPLLSYPAHFHLQVVVDRRLAAQHRTKQFLFVT